MATDSMIMSFTRVIEKQMSLYWFIIKFQLFINYTLDKFSLCIRCNSWMAVRGTWIRELHRFLDASLSKIGHYRFENAQEIICLWPIVQVSHPKQNSITDKIIFTWIQLEVKVCQFIYHFRVTFLSLSLSLSKHS